MPAALDDLRLDFRDRFLDYDELTRQLRAWADAYPQLVDLSSIGTTPEGRQLWLLTLGPEPERTRPSVWVDANMHAIELCGSSVALAIAEDVLRLHLGAGVHGLPEVVCDRLREVRFYVMPRMSPDGAEVALGTGKWVRSTPRDSRPHKQHARWMPQDLDGDGSVVSLRVEDPTGEYVDGEGIPGLLRPREITDTGPFYKVYPEGLIENFDGDRIPAPHFLSDNHVDLNRNFPFKWAPEPTQRGAGPFPASEPESRAVVEFASQHPELFAWLNLHTFGGVFIRPLGDAADNTMNRSDFALFQQIGEWAEAITGYPMVSGYEEFTYEPNTPLYGDLTEFAYRQRGAIAYVVELWDLFEELGLPRPARFVDRYNNLSRDDLALLARWDAEKNRGRMFRAWQSFDHPQLGPVEIGGVDPRVGLRNPPLERVAEICAQQSACFMRVAALAPALHIEAGTDALEGDLRRVTVTVENRGYLPTYVLDSARDIDINEAPALRVHCDDCKLVDRADAFLELGHLDGWGLGKNSDASAVMMTDLRGNSGRRRVRFVVRGKGRVTVRAGSARVGWVEQTIELD